MSKRNVSIKVTSQKELIKREVEARTFGELKKELKDVKWDGMRVVVRETKNTLQDDGALLPAGDFILFVVPEKVKSGGKLTAGKKKLKDVDKASYNDLRSHASFLNNMKKAGIAMNGGTEDLRSAVKAYYAALETPGKADDVEALAAIETARANINAAIDAIIDAAGKSGVVEDTTDYVVKVSVDDLDAEYAELKKALKL